LTDQLLFPGIVAFALLLTFLVLWGRRKPRAARAESWILVDGSNVMHWQDNLPQLAPVRAVVDELRDRGYVPGVVFDANAGWKLQGRYMHDGDFARLLGLKRRQVLVVEKGTPADPFLLQTARKFGARIVTNDRYRDWAEKHPEVLKPGFLIRGGMRDGKAWLQGVEANEGAL
jgi:Zc3h12a-like Ribonuclease NYN domain